MYLDNILSVSYTHLFNLCTTTVFSLKKMYFCSIYNLAARKAVSYTHLDVYKRQGNTSRQCRRPGRTHVHPSGASRSSCSRRG